MTRPHQVIHFGSAADGARLAYASTGRGPLVIRAAHFLTHLDFDLDSPVWCPWLTELSRHHELLRYDARGCGLSEAGSSDLSLELWVSDLEAVVAAAGVSRFALFGASQGAATAIAYAVRHPEQVACLVLLGGYARGPVRRNPSTEQLREAQLLLEAVEIGWGRESPLFRQLFTSLFLPEGSPEQMNWFNELQRRCCTPAHAAHTIAAFGRIDVSELVPRVSCPTLVLHARGDARVPFEEGRYLAGLIPGASFVPLDSRNHILLESEPAFAHCFDEVDRFLTTHLGQSQALAGLTPRELELLELLARGLDNLQIAAHLGLSEKTVRNKVSAVFDKLAVATRAQAIVRAREAGFGLASR